MMINTTVNALNQTLNNLDESSIKIKNTFENAYSNQEKSSKAYDTLSSVIIDQSLQEKIAKLQINTIKTQDEVLDTIINLKKNNEEIYY